MAENTTNTETKTDKRKNPHKVAFVPPSQELLDSLIKDGAVEVVTIPERKTKAGTKPATDIPIARKRPGILGLYNNDEKSMLYYASMMAHAQTELYRAKNSPDKVAAKNAKKAEKKVAKMSEAELDALLAIIAERKKKQAEAAGS